MIVLRSSRLRSAWNWRSMRSSSSSVRNDFGPDSFQALQGGQTLILQHGQFQRNSTERQPFQHSSLTLSEVWPCRSYISLRL
jgi:hypothetical protein